MFFMWFFLLFVILFLVLFLLLLLLFLFFFFFFFSSCLCLSDSVTVFHRPVFGHIQSDLCWFYSSTGWTILLLSALSSWSVGAGIFAPYKDIEAREALEILQTYPITFVFLPRIYIGASKEDLKRFHFPKLSTCMTGGEPMNREVMLQWKDRLDYQPLFGKGARAPVDQTRESGGNRA